MQTTSRHDRDDSEVRISRGESFVLELQALATAGYAWRVAALPDVLELREERIRPTGSAAGAPSTQEFEFRATRAGTGLLKMQLSRHWEAAAVETIVLTVVVAGVS